jgi:EmrB/QacA subfamily drug resistance transporter
MIGSSRIDTQVACRRMATPMPRHIYQVEGSLWKIAPVAVVGALLSQLNTTMINVSLSSLAGELHSGLTTIQWVTSGYLLALTLVLPLTGWLVDRLGARSLYLFCFGSFAFASTLCGFADSASSLIIARLVQGLSGGLLAPMSQMMLARNAGGQHMTRVVGYAAIPVILGPLLGPIIAGAILKYASWRWLFFINVPLGTLGFVLAAPLRDELQHRRTRDLDWAGLALLSPGLAMFLYGTGHVEDPAGLCMLIAAVLLLMAFLWTASHKGSAALIDLQLFRGKVFSVSVATQFLSNGALLAGQMLIPVYLVRACGRSPSEMGWLMAPLGLGMICTAPLIDPLTNRFGFRKVCAVGALLALAGTLPLLYLAGHGLDLVVLGMALFVRGVGQIAVGVPSISAAYASVSRRDLSMATTSLNIVQRIGGPIFTTLCATVLASRLDSQSSRPTLLDPYASAFLVLTALHALLLAVSLKLPDGSPTRSGK